MKYFLMSRRVLPATVGLTALTVVLALWGGLVVTLPMPDFIPTLAQVMPLEALILTLVVTVIALASYPDIALWERVAGRSVLLYSHVLALCLGVCVSGLYGLVAFSSDGRVMTSVKCVVMLGMVACLYQPFGSKVTLVPALLLAFNMVFARRPGSGLGPWAWLIDGSPSVLAMAVTLLMSAIFSVAVWLFRQSSLAHYLNRN